MQNKTIGNLFKGDKVVWMIFFFLCIISVIEVFSASSQLSYEKGSYFMPIFKHILLLVLGIFCIIITLNIKCKYFKIATPFLLIFSVFTLIWVFFAGQTTNGAQRWVSILGIQFQPSEIAKGTLVLATAQILSAMQTPDGTDKNAFKYILWLCVVIIPLIMVENFSTAALLYVVIIIMMFIGRVPWKQIGPLLGVTALMLVAGYLLIMNLGKSTPQTPNQQLTEQLTVKKEKPNLIEKVFHRVDTWRSRLESHDSDNDVAPEKVDLVDKGAQKAHASIAIASCNIVGKGPGNSVERDFLSQAFSDFIYAIIIEEMGIAGGSFVALLYIFLLFRAGRIALRCENNFPALLVMGLAILLVSQALFNMSVAVGIAPVTGQPLPLISKGGTSTIINCIYIGVILSISRSAKQRNGATQLSASDEMTIA